MRRLLPVISVLIASVSIRAQTQTTLPPHVDTHWYNLPLPMLSTESLPPQVPGHIAAPLTIKGKLLRDMIQDTIGPKALANRFVVAGFHQLRNRPEEWGHSAEGFGNRLGYSMARGVLENAFTTAFEISTGTDKRYDRCACAGFTRRTLHVGRRIFVIRRDGGGETIDGGRLAAAFVAPTIAFRMYPSRYYTPGAIISSGFQYLGWRVLTDFVKEFWPEIHRKYHIGPHPAE